MNVWPSNWRAWIFIWKYVTQTRRRLEPDVWTTFPTNHVMLVTQLPIHHFSGQTRYSNKQTMWVLKVIRHIGRWLVYSRDRCDIQQVCLMFAGNEREIPHSRPTANMSERTTSLINSAAIPLAARRDDRVQWCPLTLTGKGLQGWFLSQLIPFLLSLGKVFKGDSYQLSQLIPFVQSCVLSRVV